MKIIIHIIGIFCIFFNEFQRMWFGCVVRVVRTVRVVCFVLVRIKHLLWYKTIVIVVTIFLWIVWTFAMRVWTLFKHCVYVFLFINYLWRQRFFIEETLILSTRKFHKAAFDMLLWNASSIFMSTSFLTKRRARWFISPNLLLYDLYRVTNITRNPDKLGKWQPDQTYTCYCNQNVTSAIYELPLELESCRWVHWEGVRCF